MLRDFSVHQLFVSIVLISLLGLMFIVNYIDGPVIDGNIIATGGMSTNLNVSLDKEVQAGFPWGFVYGNLTPATCKPSYNLSGAEILPIQVEAYQDPAGLWIVASTNPNVNLSRLKRAIQFDIDAYLNLTGAESYSAAKTYDTAQLIKVENNSIHTFYAQTNSYSGDYRTYALQDETTGDFVYLTKYAKGRGFNNNTHDFQFILPVNGTNEYHFWAVSRVVFNLQIKIQTDAMNNSYRNVSWNPIEDALNYSIYMLDNLTDPNNSSLMNTNTSRGTKIPVGLNTTYIDAEVLSNDTDRIYQVEVQLADGVNITSQFKVGVFHIHLIHDGVTGLNLVSFPVDLDKGPLSTVLEPVYADINRAYYYNNQQKVFDAFVVIDMGGGSYLPLDMIGNTTAFGGYWIDVKRNSTLEVSGRLFPKTDLDLTRPLNLIGYHILEVDPSSTLAFEQLFPVLRRAYWYDNYGKNFFAFVVLPDGMGGYIPIPLFDTVSAKGGYYLDLSGDTHYSWPSN